MKEKSYTPYDELELYQLMNEPWEVADRPYLLHAAYALSCLTEAMETDDEEQQEIWGMRIPERILKSVVKNAAESFNDAADHRTRIDVWGKPYSVRKVNAYDRARLEDIFNFQLEDGEYIIAKSGVMKLATSEHLTFQNNKENLSKNKDYLRKVVMLAEDDEHDGWDKLTDMEVAMYCWAQYYQKHQDNNEVVFMDEYKLYIPVSINEIHKCLNEYSTIMTRLHGLYSFDRNKVMEWNDSHQQTSYADKIPKDKADDYWYDTALKTTFKPNV